MRRSWRLWYSFLFCLSWPAYPHRQRSISDRSYARPLIAWNAMRSNLICPRQLHWTGKTRASAKSLRWSPIVEIASLGSRGLAMQWIFAGRDRPKQNREARFCDTNIFTINQRDYSWAISLFGPPWGMIWMAKSEITKPLKETKCSLS